MSFEKQNSGRNPWNSTIPELKLLTELRLPSPLCVCVIRKEIIIYPVLKCAWNIPEFHQFHLIVTYTDNCICFIFLQPLEDYK